MRGCSQSYSQIAREWRGPSDRFWHGAVAPAGAAPARDRNRLEFDQILKVSSSWLDSVQRCPMDGAARRKPPAVVRRLIQPGRRRRRGPVRRGLPPPAPPRAEFGIRCDAAGAGRHRVFQRENGRSARSAPGPAPTLARSVNRAVNARRNRRRAMLTGGRRHAFGPARGPRHEAVRRFIAFWSVPNRVDQSGKSRAKNERDGDEKKGVHGLRRSLNRVSARSPET